jgi:hypothetical protein
MKPTVVSVIQAIYDPPVFSFLRPTVTPGTSLYAICVSAGPMLIPPRWDVVAEVQADVKLTVFRHVVTGDEPAIMSLTCGQTVVGTMMCVVLAVENADVNGVHRIIGTNVSDPSLEFVCPGIDRTANDAVLCIFATNGSSVLAFVPSDAIVHVNVRDDQFASITLGVFEIFNADPHTVTIDSAQPGLAATLVIPAA